MLDGIAEEANDPAELRADQRQDLVCAGAAAGRDQSEYKHLLLSHPLTSEAAHGAGEADRAGSGEQPDSTLNCAAWAMRIYNGGRYAEAGEQYHALARNATLAERERDGFAVAAAACDLKLKRLTERRHRRWPIPTMRTARGGLPADGAGA